MKIDTEHFKQKADQAVQDAAMQGALARATQRFSLSRARVFQNLPQGEDLRTRAQGIKAEVMDHLEVYLEQLKTSAEALGVKVFRARDGQAASRYIQDLIRDKQISLVVKSKSMTTEEIDLNQDLGRSGTEVWETDLGEFIIQLAEEPPSHIIGPAIHKSQEEIARLFADRLGVPVYGTPEELTLVAREFLREKYFQAGLGISGANFALARTGTLVIVENEGNARFSTTFPKIHVALMGIEKVIPGPEELSVFLKLLARSATGQKSSTYVSLIRGPSRPPEADGPEEVHLILLDNGRSRILQDPVLRSSLHCLRCGACLNVCPVYQKVGGHAYGWAYSGPIGALIVPQYLGLLRARDLPMASTLCGACAQVCPVRIPIPDLLLELRRRIQEEGAAWGEKGLIRLWVALQNHPRWLPAFFSFIKKIAGVFPGSFAPGLTFPEKSFHQWWQDEKPD
jgi:L-lactate dehydrogenase complex protein LldF